MLSKHYTHLLLHFTTTFINYYNKGYFNDIVVIIMNKKPLSQVNIKVIINDNNGRSLCKENGSDCACAI